MLSQKIHSISGEDTYSLIAKLTSDIIWEWDLAKGEITRSNGMSDAFDFFTESGRTDTQWWIDHIYIVDRNRVQKEFEDALKSKSATIWNSTYRFYKKDGNVVWVSDKACIVRDKKGKAIKLLGSMTDISESKSIENKLQMRLDFQRAIAQLGQEALSNVNIYVFLQQAVEQLKDVLDVEYTKVLELLPGKKEMMLRAGVGWHDHVKVHESTVDTGKNSQAGYTLLSKKPVIVKDLSLEKRFNGPKLLSDHGVISGMSVILYGNDGVYGVLGIHSKKKKIFTQDDIDYLQSIANIISLAIQRYQTEEQLRKSQNQFKALYDSNIIGVMYEQVNGKMIEVNDAFLQMIGYTRKEFTSKPLNRTDITPVEYATIDKKSAEHVISTGIAYPYEKEYIRKDGKRVPAIVGAVKLSQEKGEVMAFALDISERKELELKKDEFMSIASHELRTPLTSIKGYTQILERITKRTGDKKLTKYLHKTNNYVERLSNLISELLDVSKIQAGKLIMEFDTFDFDTFMDESVECMSYISSKHKIVKEGKLGSELLADKNRIEQVFNNLVTNAIKYSPNSKLIQVLVKKEGERVVVSVKDNGIGISKKDQKNLFNRFYRVESSSRNFSGLGIGLYISREIILRHGGEMWVSSKKGEGSTFSFALPLFTLDTNRALDNTGKSIT